MILPFEWASCGRGNRLQELGLGTGVFLHEHARPLNKRCAWRLTTGSTFIKMARLKAITIAIILLVGLAEYALDLTKCVVCNKL